MVLDTSSFSGLNSWTCQASGSRLQRLEIEMESALNRGRAKRSAKVRVYFLEKWLWVFLGIGARPLDILKFSILTFTDLHCFQMDLLSELRCSKQIFLLKKWFERFYFSISIYGRARFLRLGILLRQFDRKKRGTQARVCFLKNDCKVHK